MADPNPLRTKAAPMAHGRLYEARAALTMGGTLRPNSGAMASAKGDMTINNWLLELKTTTDNSLSVKLGWLVKITEESVAMGKYPALLFSFVGTNGKPRNAETEWVCIPKQKFMELISD